MKAKGEHCALAAVALATSGNSGLDAQATDHRARGSSTESEPILAFTDIWIQVVAKAWSDENFKRELLADPAKALETHFNYEISPDIRLEILERQPGKAAALTLTLPDRPPGHLIQGGDVRDDFFPC